MVDCSLNCRQLGSLQCVHDLSNVLFYPHKSKRIIRRVRHSVYQFGAASVCLSPALLEIMSPFAAKFVLGMLFASATSSGDLRKWVVQVAALSMIGAVVAKAPEQTGQPGALGCCDMHFGPGQCLKEASRRGR